MGRGIWVWGCVRVGDTGKGSRQKDSIWKGNVGRGMVVGWGYGQGDMGKGMYVGRGTQAVGYRQGDVCR